jgi:MarR family transcriptional repressor of emrRAB
MHSRARTANLLGAAALAVTDLALDGATRTAGVSASGTAALVVLSASPDLSVTELGRRVGLSQSASARMLDSLEAAGLAARRAGSGRQVSARLTPAGHRAVRDLLAARTGPLTEALGTLDDDEHETFAHLLTKLLTGLYGTVGDADLICRLCDRGLCTADAVCPVGQAERDREA